jgi:hypothetical protein
VESSSPTNKRNSHRRGRTLADFAKYVPLRLSTEERSLLNVLEQALHVSEYTDQVDVAIGVVRRGVKARRIQEGIIEICQIATGLAVASGHERAYADYSSCDGGGGKLMFGRIRNGKKKSNKEYSSNSSDSTTSWAGRDLKDNAAFFQTLFEVGRRNKVLNPSHMRSTYGKLMYILQDAQNPAVVKALGFSLYKDLQLVIPYLEENNCLEILNDPRLEGAIRFIRDREEMTGDKIDRSLVQKLVEEKRGLREELVIDYAAKTNMEPNDVGRVVDSLADAISSVQTTLTPVKRMLQYLEDEFDPNLVNPDQSLEISGESPRARMRQAHRYGFSAYGGGDREGPTLTHTHGTQYYFVWQTLRLWCKVMKNMHKLWLCADMDLLSTSTSYSLLNTGQGLNRVQPCPLVGKVMRHLLTTTQQEAVVPWVGLSVVHLGDRDVPNALIFIDKYTQIPRFLSPIVSFLQGLPDLCQDERIDAYVKERFGSPEKLKLAMLGDFFKHAFDGSGDDGGSCIDGRLTSSWNWTSRLAKKPYHHVFMLSGFQGFDGEFK